MSIFQNLLRKSKTIINDKFRFRHYYFFIHFIVYHVYSCVQLVMNYHDTNGITSISIILKLGVLCLLKLGMVYT